MLPRCFGFWVGLALWQVGGVAAAQAAADRVSMRWSAPDECPDDVQIVHEVEGLLGQSLSLLPDQAFTVRANVQGNAAQGYTAQLSFTSAQGTEQRELEHSDCQKLLQGVALVVALAIDPERVRTTQATRAADHEAPATLSPALPIASAASAPPPAFPARVTDTDRGMCPASPARAEQPLGIRLALHGVAGAGPLPGFGGGVEAAIGWQQRRFAAEVLGRYWVSRDTAVGFAPDAKLELSLVTLGARGCGRVPAGSWLLSACAGGDLGDLRATGLGVENSRTPHELFADVAGDARVAYVRSRLAPEGGFEVSGALTRPRFGVSENGQSTETFRPAAWGFSVFLGLAFEL